MPDKDSIITITTHGLFQTTKKKEKCGEIWVDFMSRNHYIAEQPIDISVPAKVSFMPDKNSIKCTKLTSKLMTKNLKSIVTTLIKKQKINSPTKCWGWGKE